MATHSYGTLHVVISVASSNCTSAARGSGVLACALEEQKCRKYSSLLSSYIFAPVCIETLGAWGESARYLIRKISARVREATGEPRLTTFLIQRLAIDVQRGNAASVMATLTLPSSRDWSEVVLLPAV